MVLPCEKSSEAIFATTAVSEWRGEGLGSFDAIGYHARTATLYSNHIPWPLPIIKGWLLPG